MEDKFVSLAVYEDSLLADQACLLLEEAGLPVLIQHLDITDGGIRATGYRLLAPSNSAQTALRLLNLKLNKRITDPTTKPPNGSGIKKAA